MRCYICRLCPNHKKYIIDILYRRNSKKRRRFYRSFFAVTKKFGKTSLAAALYIVLSFYCQRNIQRGLAADFAAKGLKCKFRKKFGGFSYYILCLQKSFLPYLVGFFAEKSRRKIPAVKSCEKHIKNKYILYRRNSFFPPPYAVGFFCFFADEKEENQFKIFIIKRLI